LPPGHTLINFQFLNNQTHAILFILFYFKNPGPADILKIKGKPICNPWGPQCLFFGGEFSQPGDRKKNRGRGGGGGGPGCSKKYIMGAGWRIQL
jgi:hypothetical protein